MKIAATAFAVCAAFGAISLGLQEHAHAQAGQGPVKVDVKEITVTLTKTPRFGIEAGTEKKRDTQRNWLEVEVEFNADMKGSDEYINELEFSYYVYLDSGGKTKSIYTAAVTHINIPKDESTFSVVYMSPTALGKLFGKEKTVNDGDVWVAVEVKLQGALVGGMTNHKTNPPWWQNQTVARVDGMLLNKAQTPFATLWWDRYPEVKPLR